MVLQRSTIQLLRFHFSFFLLPVSLFALSQIQIINWQYAIVVLAILHLLVYPASNGYNSYMDRDETPIGGLKKPMAPTRQLFYTTVIMDIAAIVLSFLISPMFSLCILLYILASRAYSYRRIRLKKYPVVGFMTVFIFQGALIFFCTYEAVVRKQGVDVPAMPCLISSLLIGALYPLTQIYQHEDDKRDGVTSISYMLGKRGTFVFSMLLFLSATFLLYLRFKQIGELNFFYLYLLIMLPVVSFFLYWMLKVWRNEAAANFRNSLLMNVLSTICTTIFFIILIIVKH
jgi:1,4-dihydroxy-2-naphthoate polyprenyltransferase